MALMFNFLVILYLNSGAAAVDTFLQRAFGLSDLMK
jgi:hypothetical protein